MGGLGLFLGAPVSAEYLAAYLPETGDLVGQLWALLFLAPLYGGPALLIREVAVRTGRGWPARLAWAAAFGVTLPCLVDGLAFTPYSPEVVFWAEYWQGTAVPALGTSALPLLAFVLGHVVMSIGAPLAMFDGLFPRLRGRPLLGRWTIGGLVVSFLVMAVLIGWEFRSTGSSPNVAQTGVSAAVVLGLLVGGWNLPRSLGPTAGTVPRPVVLLGLGSVVQFGADLVPASWLGFGILVAVLTAGSAALWRWGRRPAWGPGRLACLASGALLGRSLIGFLSPVPLDVDPTAKYVHNVVLLAAMVALAWLALRRTRAEARPPEVSPPSGVSPPAES